MNNMRNIASHDGVVKAVKNGNVEVEIESTSACASCAAHARCGFAESKNKTVAVPTDEWRSYDVGETVRVNIDESRGLLAVWIAYVLPAVLMLAAIVAMSVAGAPEWAVAAVALAVLGLFVGALYLLRSKVGRHFTLTINHQLPQNS